ncbi:hypothetical protein [Kineosporia succinea]|uniref:DUF2157 domain-containing protein n=1 Tax=Kineosporia succinea TaxID=84632 RepID=A0ABT9P0Q5_9ACTN|nr:hypothetical protein [Kineosporia succinea]MDP9826257.1 hypothetical protein [Kineosporia succinea]
MGVDPEEQVEVLQARIQDRLAELRAISQGVRVGSGLREGLGQRRESSAPQADPDVDGYDASDRPERVREIDLTDGIDLTDTRLARARWDEPERHDETERHETGWDHETGRDPEAQWDDDSRWDDEPENPDDVDTPDESHDSDFTDLREGGDLLDDESPRGRQQRHRARPGPGHDPANGTPDAGPRLLGDNRPPRTTLQDATDAVVAATRELLTYERRLPVLLDAEPRRLSLLIVRWSGVVSAAVAASLMVAALVGWLPRWWALPGLICGGAAWLLLRLPVHPPGDRHETLRPGAVVAAAGALLTAICAASGMPAVMLLLGIVAMAAGIWHVQQTPVRIGALPRRFR